MANQNGQVILQALQKLEAPATATKIATLIADTAGMHPNDVKESVEETLNGGVRYGYIKQYKRKYYAEPVDLDIKDSEPEKRSFWHNGELEDRGGRRRSRSRRRRSSQRSPRRSSRRRRRRQAIN